ncbi:MULTISPECIES: SlyX family protein [Marisediminitalea]|jgi:SlyX protein|uniref:SlyX family protein n=1 Tax=Marisediminitalea TaxID=2662254 RepID=UPI0020CE3B44|nr:SlyX family protein [Marisediminitalea aggregata]MCP3865413.1 SlyX family protein [Aestuariibacter sp.]MCP4235093.1 SlyX family protein [Aestuariibacter sp.]MCP4528379.1 SlyX family protein [Aestuariibacter sp.]MCP4946437.1 SlyX family protein [Aestuariibacter sp.]MCP5009838.1 SlyX family protein [Aestuariibacter sp.]
MTSESQQLADDLAAANLAIEELQTKLAFQEHTIDALNDALSSQQRQLEKMEFQLKHVIDKVKGMEPSNIAKMSEETPPPHY